MKIKLVSDLHLEFSDVNIVNDQDYDVLILGGDICIAKDLHEHPEPNNTADQAAIANGTGLGRRQMTAQRFILESEGKPWPFAKEDSDEDQTGQ